MFNQEFIKTNSKFVANLFKSCGLLVPFVVVSCGENPEKNQDLQNLTLSSGNDETDEKQQTTTQTTEPQLENKEKKEDGNVEATQTTEGEIEDKKQEEVIEEKKEDGNIETTQTTNQPSTEGGSEMKEKKDEQQ